jgi:hypothetical protein
MTQLPLGNISPGEDVISDIHLHIELGGATIIGSNLDKAAQDLARPLLKQPQDIQ